MTTILVTGSDGQLGSELRSMASGYGGYEFIFTDIAEMDISNPSSVMEMVSKSRPSWLINCASYTAVDKAEEKPAAAFAVNAAGPANIASALKGTDCHLIHISTDYVFPGNGNVPYTESDEPNPATVYGKSKLEGEVNVLTHMKTLIIRTSWLYSAYGSNFVKTILRLLEEGRNPKVVFDQTGSPTYAAGLAATILHIISGVIRNRFPFVPGIYHYSDEGVCSWFDIASEIALAVNREGSVTPCLSSEYLQKAPRPSYSVLDKKKIRETYNIIIPHWRRNLTLCLNSIIRPV